jgi:hypothetical protein
MMAEPKPSLPLNSKVLPKSCDVSLHVQIYVLKVLLTRIEKEILGKYKEQGTLKNVEDGVSWSLVIKGISLLEVSSILSLSLINEN